MIPLLLLFLALPAVESAPLYETDHDITYIIGKGLRCPVCQGMSIAESPSSMAQDMMKRVREMNSEGKSADDINNYFVQRYGEWVLLDPQRQGVTLWVWVMPPVALVALGLLMLKMARRQKPVSSSGAAATTRVVGPSPYLAEVRRRLEEGDV